MSETKQTTCVRVRLSLDDWSRIRNEIFESLEELDYEETYHPEEERDYEQDRYNLAELHRFVMRQMEALSE